MASRTLIESVSPRDVVTFAEGIVERFREAKPDEFTFEALMLYALAEAHLEAYESARDERFYRG